jgi:hypothetical protein
MSDDRPRSLLQRLRPPAPTDIAPAATEPAPPTALVPAEPRALEKPKRKRPLSFIRIARLVAEETGDFSAVIKVAVDIVKDGDAEPKDRIKAAEFLARWAEANPATVRHVVSGPDGKPIAHAHAHAHIVKVSQDLTHLTEEQLQALARGDTVVVPPKGAPAGDVIEVEVEE